MASTRSAIRAASLLCLVAAAQALPSQSLKRDASFTRSGCYVDNDAGNRALNGISYADDGMTVETCAAFCSQYQYFGTEYGGECYCGNSLTAQLVDDSDCSFTCAGNSDEHCGAGNRLDVFKNSGYTAPVPATLADKEYFGCFIDEGARAPPTTFLAPMT